MAKHWFWQNVAPGLLGSILVIALSAGVGELYFRLTTPFWEPSWPSRFEPAVGFLFKPGAEVRHTNHLDFWTRENANSLGFLDREPPPSFDARRCHVVLIGDSYVEAAQVPNSEKAQVVLEKRAARMHADWRLSASAFGYSGTGQLNQLPFYDRFARDERPALVVLVFAWNDFANNSTLLEAIRNGWHPDHPPRVFARRDPVTGRHSIIDIDPQWEKHLLPAPAAIAGEGCWSCRVHTRLKEWSLFYRWLAAKLRLLAPAVIARVEPVTADRSTPFRIQWLSKLPAFGATLRGWDGASNMDAAFYERRLLPVFAEALDLTGFALDEFKRRTARDGAHLLVLATSQMSERTRSGDPAYRRRYVERLRALTEARGIPMIDQYDWIVARGLDPTWLRFRHDSHWSPLAHEVGADMLLGYLEANPRICSSRRPLVP